MNERSLLKWLVFILVMAFTRLFLFNYVQINTHTDDVMADSSSIIVKEIQRNTYVIGWLLFGNLADNAFNPKDFLVICCLIIGLYYILLGFYL